MATFASFQRPNDHDVSGVAVALDLHKRHGLGSTHYECHHAERVVVGTTPFYFITEEEYLAHWNAFHAAISP